MSPSGIQNPSPSGEGKIRVYWSHAEISLTFRKSKFASGIFEGQDFSIRL